LKKRIELLAALLGILLLLSLYQLSVRLLYVEIPTAEADAIVVLGGESADRVYRTAEHYHKGLARVIIVSGAGDCRLIKNRLLLTAVPDTAIIVECRSRSTKENAEFSAALLHDIDAERIIIVTSWFHSRRSLSSFRKYAPGYELYAMPAYHGISMERKPQLAELYYILTEYIKIGGYIFVHGIVPWRI
jgi:uncharacterized SAM-binding protein YcdF (DUF218 family)